MNTYFKTLKSILEGKDAITFFSGAGLSVSSGLPDFRSDKDGFWKSNTPVHFRDFINNSESRKKSWENNLAIHKKISGAIPTKMHNLINELINKNTKNFHITQNIDGLHKNIENPNNVLELHGNIFNCGCLTCSFESPTIDFYEKYKNEVDMLCPSCLDGLIKVKTISFGQSLDQNILSIAHQASATAKNFIVMGSSLKVSPANSFIKVAKANEAKIIILNKDKTPFDDYADIVINDDLENIYEQIK